MPYILSFEVHRRYAMRVETVSEAITRYDETYRLIGAWLERYGASADIRCVESGRVLQLYRGITAIEAAQELGEVFRWKSDGNTWMRTLVTSRR
jgi:hypothetical protein